MITRRNFIRTTFLLTTIFSFTEVFAFSKTDRFFRLLNIHTGERLKAKYYESGEYNKEAINNINHLMRCHHTDEIMPMDVKLLDLLCAIKDVFGRDREVHIISGFRSQTYNEYLRSLGKKVVKNSLHLYGLAIDFAIPKVDTGEISKVAKSFSAGGVGKYPDFVHIDVGRVRYW